jgi:hypothetical protein
MPTDWAAAQLFRGMAPAAWGALAFPGDGGASIGVLGAGGRLYPATIWRMSAMLSRCPVRRAVTLPRMG